MAKEYIERTEELILAVNAGARAIENNKQYHGTIYNMDVFSNEPKEIPYLRAAQVLRSVDEIPVTDVVEVVRCGECKYSFQDRITGNLLCDRKMLGLVRQEDFCSFGERRVNDAED